MTRHTTDTWPVKRFGAQRFQARCEGCPFKGEFRRDRESAEQDGALHEATAGGPVPEIGETSGVGRPE